MEEDQLEKVEKFDIMEPINNQKEDGEQKDEVQNETKKKVVVIFQLLILFY